MFKFSHLPLTVPPIGSLSNHTVLIAKKNTNKQTNEKKQTKKTRIKLFFLGRLAFGSGKRVLMKSLAGPEEGASGCTSRNASHDPKGTCCLYGNQGAVPSWLQALAIKAGIWGSTATAEGLPQGHAVPAGRRPANGATPCRSTPVKPVAGRRDLAWRRGVISPGACQQTEPKPPTVAPAAMPLPRTPGPCSPARSPRPASPLPPSRRVGVGPPSLRGGSRQGEAMVCLLPDHSYRGRPRGGRRSRKRL